MAEKKGGKVGGFCVWENDKHISFASIYEFLYLFL